MRGFPSDRQQSGTINIRAGYAARCVHKTDDQMGFIADQVVCFNHGALFDHMHKAGEFPMSMKSFVDIICE